jgi:hypothetical protein
MIHTTNRQTKNNIIVFIKRGEVKELAKKKRLWAISFTARMNLIRNLT